VKVLPARLEGSSLIFLAFVIPLAVYCLVLAVINRSRHPVMVSGPWDFAGVLFAASGMLILGGPAILTGLYEQWRLSWLLGQTRYLQALGENWAFWVSLWFLYFVFVAGGSALILWRRRALTSIYNVEPDVLTEVLTETFDRVGVEWQRHGPRHLLLRFRDAPLEEGIAHNSRLVAYPLPTAQTPALAADTRTYGAPIAITARSAYPWTELILEPFPLLHHVVLRWTTQEGALRLEVESELAKALGKVWSGQSPVGAWFLSVALGLFFSAFLLIMTLLAIRFFSVLL
jgi:hypothetical protein